MACPVGTGIQSLRFDRKVFSRAQAQAWCRRHGRPSTIDETVHQYRVRVYDPKFFESDSFRTIELTRGVSAVIGCPLPESEEKMASKKRTTKKRRSKKTASKGAVKRRRAGHQEPRGKGPVKLEVKSVGALMGSKGTLYHAFLRSGREKTYLGHVVAKNVTEAKRKAARCVRTNL